VEGEKKPFDEWQIEKTQNKFNNLRILTRLSKMRGMKVKITLEENDQVADMDFKNLSEKNSVLDMIKKVTKIK